MNFTKDMKNFIRADAWRKGRNMALSLVQPIDNIYTTHNPLMGYTIGRMQEFNRIDGVYSIFMGAWNDPLLGYNGYAINEPFILDGLWNIYNEEVPAPKHNTKEYDEYEEGFSKWLYENKELLIECLDAAIEGYQKSN